MAVPQRSVPDIADLRRFYVGRDVADVPKPAVVIDRAMMRRHCDSLLEAVDNLGVDFRAHVKTHKTREGARLQAGEAKDVKLVASTIPELEHLLPLVDEFRSDNRSVNILYGIPLPSSQVTRLAEVGRKLGHGSISVLVDHAEQLPLAAQFYQEAKFPADIFVKVDTGYHRAGLPPSGLNKGELIPGLMELERAGKARFVGLYSHSSLSYNDSTPDDAMGNLEGEINGCLDALNKTAHLFPKEKELVISVGASPQVTAVENLAGQDAPAKSVDSLRRTMQSVMTGQPSGLRTKLELHAGVYALLDVQQMSTKSRAKLGDHEDEIAISVVTEVCSLYNNGERQQPEALLAVGCLGLGREPCAAYKGWGVVHREAYSPVAGKTGDGPRLIVTRISQEHSIVSWEGDAAAAGLIPFRMGQSVRILPNHACVTGAGYGWYLAVDSSDSQNPTKVVDVWTRASGW